MAGNTGVGQVTTKNHSDRLTIISHVKASKAMWKAALIKQRLSKQYMNGQASLNYPAT